MLSRENPADIVFLFFFLFIGFYFYCKWDSSDTWQLISVELICLHAGRFPCLSVLSDEIALGTCMDQAIAHGFTNKNTPTVPKCYTSLEFRLDGNGGK